MRLRSPQPSDSWRRQQENRGAELGVITCSMDANQSVRQCLSGESEHGDGRNGRRS